MSEFHSELVDHQKGEKRDGSRHSKRQHLMAEISVKRGERKDNGKAIPGQILKGKRTRNPANKNPSPFMRKVIDTIFDHSFGALKLPQEQRIPIMFVFRFFYADQMNLWTDETPKAIMSFYNLCSSFSHFYQNNFPAQTNLLEVCDMCYKYRKDLPFLKRMLSFYGPVFMPVAEVFTDVPANNVPFLKSSVHGQPVAILGMDKRAKSKRDSGKKFNNPHRFMRVYSRVCLHRIPMTDLKAAQIRHITKMSLAAAEAGLPARLFHPTWFISSSVFKTAAYTVRMSAPIVVPQVPFRPVEKAVVEPPTSNAVESTTMMILRNDNSINLQFAPERKPAVKKDIIRILKPNKHLQPKAQVKLLQKAIKNDRMYPEHLLASTHIEEVESPSKFGKAYSSDVTGDGPSSVVTNLLIYDYIWAHPGLTAVQLARAFDIPKTVMNTFLYKSKEMGYLCFRQQNKDIKPLWFCGDELDMSLLSTEEIQIPKECKPLLLPANSMPTARPLEEVLLNFVRQNHGCDVSEIFASNVAMGISKKDLNKALYRHRELYFLQPDPRKPPSWFPVEATTASVAAPPPPIVSQLNGNNGEVTNSDDVNPPKPTKEEDSTVNPFHLDPEEAIVGYIEEHKFTAKAWREAAFVIEGENAPSLYWSGNFKRRCYEWLAERLKNHATDTLLSTANLSISRKGAKRARLVARERTEIEMRNHNSFQALADDDDTPVDEPNPVGVESVETSGASDVENPILSTFSPDDFSAFTSEVERSKVHKPPTGLSNESHGYVLVALNNHMIDHKMNVYEAGGGGDCFYHSIAGQLKRGFINSDLSAWHIRQQVADHLSGLRALYKDKFVVDGRDKDPFSTLVARTRLMGTYIESDMEIRAASDSYNVIIHVYHHQGVQHERRFIPLDVTEAEHLMMNDGSATVVNVYKVGDHYQAVCPYHVHIPKTARANSKPQKVPPPPSCNPSNVPPALPPRPPPPPPPPPPSVTPSACNPTSGGTNSYPMQSVPAGRTRSGVYLGKTYNFYNPVQDPSRQNDYLEASTIPLDPIPLFELRTTDVVNCLVTDKYARNEYGLFHNELGEWCLVNAFGGVSETFSSLGINPINEQRIVGRLTADGHNLYRYGGPKKRFVKNPITKYADFVISAKGYSFLQRLRTMRDNWFFYGRVYNGFAVSRRDIYVDWTVFSMLKKRITSATNELMYLSLFNSVIGECASVELVVDTILYFYELKTRLQQAITATVDAHSSYLKEKYYFVKPASGVSPDPFSKTYDVDSEGITTFTTRTEALKHHSQKRVCAHREPYTNCSASYGSYDKPVRKAGKMLEPLSKKEEKRWADRGFHFADPYVKFDYEDASDVTVPHQTIGNGFATSAAVINHKSTRQAEMAHSRILFSRDDELEQRYKASLYWDQVVNIFDSFHETDQAYQNRLHVNLKMLETAIRSCDPMYNGGSQIYQDWEDEGKEHLTVTKSQWLMAFSQACIHHVQSMLPLTNAELSEFNDVEALEKYVRDVGSKLRLRLDLIQKIRDRMTKNIASKMNVVQCKPHEFQKYKIVNGEPSLKYARDVISITGEDWVAARPDCLAYVKKMMEGEYTVDFEYRGINGLRHYADEIDVIITYTHIDPNGIPQLIQKRFLVPDAFARVCSKDDLPVGGKFAYKSVISDTSLEGLSKVMTDVHNRLLAEPGLIFALTHGDDQIVGVHNVDPTLYQGRTGVFYIEGDINDNDGSHVDQFYRLDMRTFVARGGEVPVNAFAQLAKPLLLVNPNNIEQYGVLRRRHGMQMCSGSVHTTYGNSKMSMNVALSLLFNRSVEYDSAASSVGMNVTSLYGELEDVTFLSKNFYLSEDDKGDQVVKVFSDLASLCRKVGRCTGDVEGRTAMPICVRFDDHNRGVVQGWCHEPKSTFIDIMRERYVDKQPKYIKFFGKYIRKDVPELVKTKFRGDRYTHSDLNEVDSAIIRHYYPDDPEIGFTHYRTFLNMISTADTYGTLIKSRFVDRIMSRRYGMIPVLSPETPAHQNCG